MKQAATVLPYGRPFVELQDSQTVCIWCMCTPSGHPNICRNFNVVYL
jgi:hypothetical protein